MLAAGDVLQTWALEREPAATVECGAERLPDHRLAYLDYEGEVTGGRGTVTRHDWGTYAVCASGTSENAVVVQLDGQRLRGTAMLVRLEGGDQRWRFSFVSGGTAARGRSADSTTGDASDGRATVQPAT